jgi:hypothetical protein
MATTLLLLAVGLVAAAAALARQTLAAREQPTASQKSDVRGYKPPADDKDDSVEVSGRVVGPEGKPVVGAKVFFARSALVRRDSPPPPAIVTSDAEGRFRLRVARTGYLDEHEKADWLRGAIVAVGKGNAFGWAGGRVDKQTNVTVRLGKDVPIQGRVVDLEGRPIGGVKVQVRSVRFREDGGDLKAFVADLQSGMYARGEFLPGFLGTEVDPALLGLKRRAVTGADGRFQFAGISSECKVGLRLTGPTIETVEVFALTHPTRSIRLPRHLVYHGPTFEHAAAPTRPIAGVVRDRDTGKPLAGVTVRARFPSYMGDSDPEGYLRATTDSQGRYRLVGLSRQGGQRLQIVPGPGQPYLGATRKSPAGSGLDPVTMDFTLKRGVWVRGRVTDKETGRPVAARVQYGAFVDNPHLKETADFTGSERIEVRTAADGSFSLVGLPGRGLLAVKAADRKEGRYRMSVGAGAIQGPRFGHTDFHTEPALLNQAEFNTLVAINPARDAEAIVANVVLDPGKTVTGTLVDPDGKLVTGGRMDGAVRDWFNRGDLPTGQFRITGVDLAQPRWILFRHRGRSLGAIVQFKGDERMPVTVRLQKLATIRGRLVDDDGQPRDGWLMGGYHQGKLFGNSIGLSFGMRKIGKDGRFRIEGMVPGMKVGLFVGKNTSFFDPLVPDLTLAPGEVKDVGDVKVKAGQ